MNTNITFGLYLIMAMLHLALAGINLNDNLIFITQLIAAIFWFCIAKTEYKYN